MDEQGHLRLVNMFVSWKSLFAFWLKIHNLANFQHSNQPMINDHSHFLDINQHNFQNSNINAKQNQTQQFRLFEFCLKIHTFANLQLLLLKTKVKSQKSFAFCRKKSTKFGKYHHKRQKNQTRQFCLFRILSKNWHFCYLTPTFTQNPRLCCPGNKK